MEAVIVTGIIGGVGAIVSSMTGYLLGRRKQADAQELKLTPHLMQRLDSVEQEGKKCQDERMKDREEIGGLKARMDHIEQQKDMRDMVSKGFSAVLSAVQASSIQVDALRTLTERVSFLEKVHVPPSAPNPSVVVVSSAPVAPPPVPDSSKGG